MSNLLHNTVIANMDVQPLWLMVHCLHAIRLQNAMFLGKIVLRKGLKTAYVSL